MIESEDLHFGIMALGLGAVTLTFLQAVDFRRIRIRQTLELAPEPQCQRADQTADAVGRQVVPTRLPAGQEDLMPLVERANQQGPCDGQQRHAPATKPATQPQRNCQQRIQAAMSKFVPGRRHQPDGKRLRAQGEQPEQNPHRQQRRSDLQVSRQHASKKQNDH